MKDYKAIKRELQNIIKQKKLIPLKIISELSKWKEIQFLEDIIDDHCKVIIYLINGEKQDEINSFNKEKEENFNYWVSTLSSEYNGVVYYFIDKIFTVTGSPSIDIQKKAWTESEVRELYKKINTIESKKKLLSVDDVLQYFNGDTFYPKFQQQIRNVVIRCLDLYNSANLNQRKFDSLCKKFEKKYEEEILTLDSEDKEHFSSAFDKLAETLQLKNRILK